MANTLLVVEDDQSALEIHFMWLRVQRSVDIVVARTLAELDEMYEAYHDDLVGIILDGQVPDRDNTTIPFIERIAGSFKGIMLAASVEPDFRRKMLAAGCTHESDKNYAVRAMFKLLDAT